MKTHTLVVLLLTQIAVVSLSMISPVSAETELPLMKVEPPQYTAPLYYINETFSVNITINNIEASVKLVGVHLRLGYYPELLEVLDVKEGTFLSQFNQTSTLPYTFFVSYVEEDGIYGPHILVGTLILPNATGGYPGPFPEGNGTIATITFKETYQPIHPEPPASCNLTLLEVILLDPDENEIPCNIQDGYYEVSSLYAPTFVIEPASYNATARGEIFDINVDLNNVDSRWCLVGAHFRLSYDPNLLEILDVKEGTFLSQFNQTSTLPYTFFVSYVEEDGIYGPHILVGTLILPNATGGYPGPFPEGNGTIATITFNATRQTTIEPEPPANCTLEFAEAILINDLGEELQYNTTSSFYQIPPLLYPVPTFNYEPAVPSAGEVVLFNASESYDPDYEIATYSWDFGDGTIINTKEPIIGHVYSQQKKFNATLTVIDIDGLSANITKTITVGYYEELTVNIDVGSTHFLGELADFYILTSDFGRRIDATRIKTLLYYNGSLFADLTNVTQHVSTGLYRIAYEIPSEAEPGTYTLVVEVECYTVKGTNLKSFLVSQTLSGFVTDITQGIATVSNGLTEVKMNLTAINAKLISIEGNIGIINSTVGTLKTSIENLNATITDLIANSEGEILANITTSLNTLTVKLDSIDGKIGEVNGDTVTIFTTLGEIETKLSDTQSTATTILYLTSTLSAIAVVLAAVILILLRKK